MWATASDFERVYVLIASIRGPKLGGYGKVFIIDNHPLTRKGLASLIEVEAGFVMCGQVADEKEALEHLETLEPDLVVLDLIQPGMRGLTLIEQVHARRPLVFTNRTACARRALQAGARGYISKEDEEEEIIQAIGQVLAGKVYVSDAIYDRLLLDLVSDPLPSPTGVLSKRELEVFELIGRGKDAAAVAEKLGISS